MSCPDCGVDEPTNTCCVWAKARAYDDLVEEYQSLETENYELRGQISDLEYEKQTILDEYT